MAAFWVEMVQDAYLRTWAEVEAVTAEAARLRVLDWSEAEREECFEGEQYHLTGDVDVLAVERVEG